MTQRVPLSLAQQLVRSTGLQLMLVASAVGILTYSLGRNSGLQRSEHHRATLPVVQVTEKLSSKLREPIHLNELNQAAIKADPTLLTNFDKLGLRFWRQLKSFSIDYINYGATDGSFLGLEKTADGQLLHNEDSERFGRGQLTVFTLSAEGIRQQQDAIYPGMTATHQEAWYVDTVRSGTSTWSRIYAWEDQPEIHSISYNTPIYDGKQQLLGVIGVDMVISQLSTWLQQAWTNEVGLALIVEADGTLIASSNPDITITEGQDKPQRRNLKDITAPLPQAFSRLFFQSPTHSAGQQEQPSFNAAPQLLHQDGAAFMLKATPWGGEQGLNWVLLTAISADNAISQANRNLGIAISISLAAMASALLINQRLINRILQPLSALQTASKTTEDQIRHGRDPQPSTLGYHCELDQRSGRELLDLNAAIEAMVKAFNDLAQDLAQKEQQTLALMSNKLKSSLEAASIAHEINQPLSIIKLTAQSLLHPQKAQEQTHLPESMRNQIATLHQQAERVGRITDQMKAMLRSASGSQTRLDLRDVIQSSLTYVRSNFRQARPWIKAGDSAEDTTTPAWINGDAIQLQIAIINLLKNAIEALSQPADQIDPPEIVLTLSEHSDHWSIVISDNGPGLAESVITDQPLASSKEDGIGLGLFIVRAAMESHQGRFELTSNTNQGGTRASLMLPKPS